uniref:Uncharacterized protein n=1 Tax=candidate division WOR-3 bacterium TaxID=2052148 RepID=A0A7C4U8U4_UNCW3
MIQIFSKSAFPPEITKVGFTSSIIMILAAVLLWLTFLIFGIIAKRYEVVLRKKTGWQFIIASPSGILIFAIIMLYSNVILGKLKMGFIESLIGYGLFLISSFFSLLGALNFRKVVSPRKKGGMQ